MWNVNTINKLKKSKLKIIRLIISKKTNWKLAIIIFRQRWPFVEFVTGDFAKPKNNRKNPCKKPQKRSHYKLIIAKNSRIRKVVNS